MAKQIDPVVQSYLDYIKLVREKKWAKLVQIRDYEKGDADTQMTDDQKILLVGADSNGNPNSDPEFNINVCRPICAAPVDRLNISGARIVVPDNKELSETLSKELWRWWEASNMGEGHQNISYSAVRDGDSYPIVSHDGNRPELSLNKAYDGESGTEIAYENEHPDKQLYAVKRWEKQRPVTGNATTNKVTRMNIYFDNRIEYYISRGMIAGSEDSGWQRIAPGDADYNEKMQEETLFDAYDRPYMATVEWLTSDGTANGEPLGNPVKHMRHDSRGEAYGRSRLADVVPDGNDAVNRAGVALQAAGLLDGFKEIFIFGFYPEIKENGVNTAIARSPGATHFFDKSEISMSQTTETDLMQLIAMFDKWLVVCATLTNTPLSLFNLTAHTPAEGTQKQLESALVQSVEALQETFGSTWRAIFRQMLKFDAVYNKSSKVPLDMLAAIDDWDINIQWDDPQTRNEKEEREIAVIDYRDLDVPVEYVWERFFSAEDIERFKAMQSLKRAAALGDMANEVLRVETENADMLAAAKESRDDDNGTDREPVAAITLSGNGTGN